VDGTIDGKSFNAASKAKPACSMVFSLENVRLHLLRIGHVLKTLHWISHILRDNLKLICLEMCQKMLAALRVQEHNQSQNIVTGDESWFYFEYVRDRLWISSLGNTPDYPNRRIATETHLLTVS
jgi:hypothetical protein